MPPSLAPHLAYKKASLFIEDCSLHDLGQRFGTPLYVYSQTAILQSLQGYQQALQGRDHLICYAVKANSNLAVLQTLAQVGCGFDIVSEGELLRVLAAGGPANKIVFSGVGKTRSAMVRALTAGVLCFNVESEAELTLLSKVASELGLTAQVSLRVNPDVDANTHPYISTGLKDNKFGIAHDRAKTVYQRAAELPNLRVVGIDCHIGSQITQISPFINALDRLLDLMENLQNQGLLINHIDMGGGLGITYDNETPPTPQALVQALLNRLDERGHGQRKILFEPGRSLVGQAGVLVSEVLYLKPGAHKNFCIVDAAMNDLARPAMYDAWMNIVPCIQRHGSTHIFDVVGPVCESGDWLGRERNLCIQEGDCLAILGAGAYGMSMASNYNTRARPAEIMVQGEQAWLIRDREDQAALFANEHLLPPSQARS